MSFGPKALWEARGVDLSRRAIPGTPKPACSKPTMSATPAKAKEIAKDAGYDGAPIRLLVSTNYQAHFDQATVFTKQLADAGINVQMMVVDWATLLKMRGQAEQWDIFVTHHGFVPDPILITFLNDELSRLVEDAGEGQARGGVHRHCGSGGSAKASGQRSRRCSTSRCRRSRSATPIPTTSPRRS